MELLPWGSRSRRSVFEPRLAKAAARLMAVVVLPTPPFWFAIAIITLGRYTSFATWRILHRKVAGVTNYFRPFFFTDRRFIGFVFFGGDGVSRSLDHFQVDEDRTVSAES